MVALNSGVTARCFPTLPTTGCLNGQGAIVDNKRLGRALAVAKLVQDKRDNTRSQGLPAGHGPSRRREKKVPAKKRQRAVNEDDLREAIEVLPSFIDRLTP